ncbi:oxidoreductase [Mactra antiquata]
MLRGRNLVAFSRMAAIQQRAICLSAATKGSVIPADASIDLKTYEHDNIPQAVKDQYYPHLGNRDIVGPSYGTSYDYLDCPDLPMPAVRWGANTPEVLQLREKETGDWKNLSLEEKKQLYRNSYRQTFAEIEAPTGEWKRILYIFCYITAAATVYLIYYANTVPRPSTLNKDHQQEMVATMLMRNNGPITGLASKYDFENNQWKK